MKKFIHYSTNACKMIIGGIIVQQIYYYAAYYSMINFNEFTVTGLWVELLYMLFLVLLSIVVTTKVRALEPMESDKPEKHNIYIKRKN